MKICFIGHEYHKKTKSSEFFLNEFSEYSVEKYFINESNDGIIDRVAAGQFDLVICWQFDFLAPKLKQLGLNTVAVPMYDGSGSLSDKYWKNFDGIKILNFSWWLHYRCKSLDLNSYYIKYFPNPNDYEQVDFSNGINGFLWQRRYNEVSWRMVISDLILHQMDSFHIHCKNDYGREDLDLPNDLEQNMHTITLSKWFENKSELEEVLNKSNIYFAPRATEGIGMGFLEAMARGMAVIANDLPTHNEYISNWVNGILYNRQNPVYIDLSSAEKIGKMARESVFRGHHRWIENINSMKNFILN